MKVYRVRNTGEIYSPYKNRHGKHVLADPRHGDEKHLKKNAIYVDNLSDALVLIERQGFHLWMKGELTGQQNLIAPQNIIIERV